MHTKFAHWLLRAAMMTGSTAAWAFGSVQAAAGGVSAGTIIENTAVATYDDGGASRTITSNTVAILVDELLDVTVTSLNSQPLLASPGEAVLTFEVTNQGNGPEAFDLIARTNLADNEFETAFTNMAIDSNGNGAYDDGVDEILAASQSTPVLAADEALLVFVILDVPVDVADQATSEVELVANAATGTGSPGTEFAGQGEGGGDAIVGASTASASARGGLRAGVTTLSLSKSVSFQDPFGEQSAVPGTLATFALVADVTGSGSIDDLIVSDAIPEGTTYAEGSLKLDGAPLTDAAGDDAGEASNQGGISVSLGSAAAGSQHTIMFTVTID
ncbi:MAG: hypothetical protein HRT64_02435 [Erythrobacter sp.]|nr:hypothetical protein [Erythrobacter sp.]